MEGENRRDEYPEIDDQSNTGDFSGLAEENGENYQNYQATNSEIDSKIPSPYEGEGWEGLLNQNPPRNQIIEKLKIGGVAIVVVVVSIVSYFQFMKTVNMPITSLFAGEDAVADSTTNAESCTGGNCELQKQILALLQQQKQDTDGDGLSDYEELYVYQTSPFLEDSDSDGYTDKTEVDNGKDPNCPAGTDCFTDLTTANNTNTDATGGYIDPNVQAFAIGQSSPATLRTMMLRNGFAQEDLDKITDDQLVQVYQQVLSGQDPNFDALIANGTNATSTAGNATTNSNASIDATNLTSIEDLQALSGAQIRELMISQGASTDMLSTLSDDELKQAFLSQLQARIDSNNTNSDNTNGSNQNVDQNNNSNSNQE